MQKTTAILLISVLFLIYLPIALAGYFAYGGAVQSNIVLSISDGPIRIAVEVMLLLHLVRNRFRPVLNGMLLINSPQLNENIVNWKLLFHHGS